MNTHLEVILRLREIARRSAALSATRSELADLASELDNLRSLNGKTRLLVGPSFLDQKNGGKLILYRRLKHN
jgi:hypothetical protein